MHLSSLSTNTLCQLKYFLGSISEETYRNPILELSNASIGQHTRHIIEFYTCLVEQIKTNEVVNYDKRLRNIVLETSLEKTKIEIDALCKEIDSIKITDDIMLEGVLGSQNHSLPTSTERELLYVLEHAIHHMAIIKIAVKILKVDINLAPNFGVAESTLAHKKCVQ